MNAEEKKTLEILTEATKDLPAEKLVTIKAGDVATICRLAAAANATTSTTPTKTGDK